MTHKHTKGPWTVKGKMKAQIQIKSSDPHNNQIIAIVNGIRDASANAQLIAAHNIFMMQSRKQEAKHELPIRLCGGIGTRTSHQTRTKGIERVSLPYWCLPHLRPTQINWLQKLIH